jgi:SAM-dependent methyltransferase
VSPVARIGKRSKRVLMSVRKPPGASRNNWAERAAVAIRAGDLITAERCLREAVRTDRRNVRYRLHWASVLEELAEYGAAAEQLTEALHLAPEMSAAANQLSVLLGRHAVPADSGLNPDGLRAALDHDGAAGFLICDLAVAYLTTRAPLRTALEVGRQQGWVDAARMLALRKTAEPLRDPLFLAVLARGALRHLDLERLLTALRRVLLLDMRPGRWRDADLTKLAVAMMLQCHANEHVWAVTAEEAVILDRPFDPERLLAGDRAAGREFLVRSLYRGAPVMLGKSVSESALGNVRPRELREAIQAIVAEEADLRSRAANIPALGSIADATSRKVAIQYERNPYPRWTSAHVPSPGEMRKRFGEFFKPAQLAFMDQPFEMLIAGCGTGKQAVVSALSLPNARVAAIDLSAHSLAYAARMARRLGVERVTFAQADILDIHDHAPQLLSRFKVIACVGVLHHMADPFEGWRRLVDCLVPGGLMLVGLYSGIARRHLTALREDAAYPGAGCSDADLRAFRQVLIDRPQGAAGSELAQSTDFYTMSEFRDLVAHVSEQHLTLSDIGDFLTRNGLTYRGFWLDPFWVHKFRQSYPEEPWPGRLEAWEEFEIANPAVFSGMYLFWCDKA